MSIFLLWNEVYKYLSWNPINRTRAAILLQYQSFEEEKDLGQKGRKQQNSNHSLPSACKFRDKSCNWNKVINKLLLFCNWWIMNYDPIELHLYYTKISSSCPEYMLSPWNKKRRCLQQRFVTTVNTGGSVNCFASGVNF